MANEERFAFVVDWFDVQAGLVRKYNLIFYPRDNACEMFDLKNSRPFLKRTKCDHVTRDELYLGNQLNLLSRKLKIVDFADESTRKSLGSGVETTFALIKPGAMPQMGEILDEIERRGFKLTKIKSVQLSRDQAAAFYSVHRDRPFYNNLVQMMTSGPILVMALMAPDAVNSWRRELGPTNPDEARRDAASSLRARFGGADVTNNALHGSDSCENARAELAFFFGGAGDATVKCPGALRSTAAMLDGGDQFTCALIKPHLVAQKKIGKVVCAIENAGFKVNAIWMHRLDLANAHDFLEVYKGVLNEYTELVNELVSGSCVAMEIGVGRRDPSEIVSSTFREFCGPMDPEIARHIRPRCLRAMFGQDKPRNGVHCTDLVEDAGLELRFMFDILAN